MIFPLCKFSCLSSIFVLFLFGYSFLLICWEFFSTPLGMMILILDWLVWLTVDWLLCNWLFFLIEVITSCLTTLFGLIWLDYNLIFCCELDLIWLILGGIFLFCLLLFAYIFTTIGLGCFEVLLFLVPLILVFLICLVLFTPFDWVPMLLISFFSYLPLLLVVDFLWLLFNYNTPKLGNWFCAKAVNCPLVLIYFYSLFILYSLSKINYAINNKKSLCLYIICYKVLLKDLSFYWMF